MTYNTTKENRRAVVLAPCIQYMLSAYSISTGQWASTHHNTVVAEKDSL